MEAQMEAHTDGQQMVPINPTVVETPAGLVLVWGFEHVSAKMLDVLKVVLSHDGFDMIYHGIKSVVFRIDGFPKVNGKSVCATFSPDVSGISINLEKTLEKTIERSMDHPETSLLASWWIEMLLNFGHEAHHGVRWDTDREKLHANEGLLLEKEELLAEKYAESLISELVKEYNVEMPPIEEEVWFNSQISELFDGKGEDLWAKTQKEMLTEKIVWRCEPKDSEEVVVHTFKEFICLITKGNINSEEWSKPTVTLDNDAPTLDEQVNGKKVTMNATGEQKETVKPPPTPAATNPASSDFAGGMFVDDDEDCDIYEEDEEYDPEPAQLVQPVVTAQFDNQQPHTTTQPHNMAVLSRIVQTVYTKMYKFIFTNCGQLKNSEIGFSNPEAVLTTPLPLTEEEKEVFVSMNHLDVNGRWCPNVSTANGLLGKVMSKTKLPAYEVVLNVNGTLHRRLFIPQNPGKRNNGVLTQRALEAQSGDTIAYTKNSETNVWGPYFVNGEYKLPRGK